jgi:tRNA threonylcarbamoyl adenosine modification protein YjeE
VVFLDGPLGAGKSALARAIILARLAEEGRVEDAPSPTYTLVQRYETARGPILHADLYRLSDPEEAEELDLIEPDPRAVLLIEWPDRLGGFAPARRLELTLALPGRGGTGRLMRATAAGEGWARAIDALGDVLE